MPNPYDFVPFFQGNLSPRCPPGHDRFTGWSGTLVCQLKTITPLFVAKYVPAGSNPTPRPMLTCGGVPAIPGSTLKGVLRSVVEAIGPCCVLLCDERERSRIPNPNLRKPCRSLQQACLACRLFGLLTEGGEGYQGNVRFSDALLREPQNWEQVECIQQQMRRPGVHCPFYCTPPNFRQFIGRKFYLHGKVVNLGELQRVDARLGVTGNRNLRRRTPPPRRQDKIQAVVPGQTFQFTVHFANVTKEDLPFLFYALVLEESMWHKIGYGKPLGFGTCKIQVTCLRLMPPRSQRERFLSFEGPVEVVDLQGEDAHQKAQELAHEISNRSDLQPQLEALRRIWGRDREPAGGYHSTPQRRHLYPTYQWFQDDRTCGGAHYRTSLADYNCQWDPMENPP